MTLEAADVAADAALATRAAGGDEPAFGQLMRRHKEPLYRVLRRLTGHDEDALDLVQESFVAAWRGLPGYDPSRPFGAWLRRIAINKARDRARRRAVRRFVAALLPGDVEPANLADPAPSPETAAGDAQALRRLDAAIAALPAALKEPLVLTAIDGMSQLVAGEALGISEKAVEMRVRRARAALRAALGDDFAA